MARSSCSYGSLGNSRPVSSRTIALELAGQRAQVVGGQLGVLLDAAGVLGRLERLVETFALHVHDDPPEHLDEAPIGVPAEPLVAGQGDQAVERLLVEAQVEDGVHHPGHGELGARADRDEERVGGVAEALAGRALDLVDRLEDVVPEPVGQLLAGREVVVAGLGRDGEAGRDREAGVGHLGEARALAAEQVAHRGVALGPAVAPREDVALGGAMRTIRGRGRGRGHRKVLRVWATGVPAWGPCPQEGVGRRRVDCSVATGTPSVAGRYRSRPSRSRCLLLVDGGRTGKPSVLDPNRDSHSTIGAEEASNLASTPGVDAVDRSHGASPFLTVARSSSGSEPAHDRDRDSIGVVSVGDMTSASDSR